MNTPYSRRQALVLLLAAAVGAAESPLAAADDPKAEKTETRNQAVLKVKGTFPDGGGLKVTDQPTSGPGANMELPDAAVETRGILDEGDLITAVEGKKFKDRREFLDLMNAAYVKNDGKVRITVKDANTDTSVVWLVRPEVVENMEVPAAKLDFLAELGKPVPAAPPVPLVPATIDR